VASDSDQYVFRRACALEAARTQVTSFAEPARWKRRVPRDFLRSLMKPILRCLALSIPVLAALSTSPPVTATELKNKEEAVASIEKRKVEMIKLSDQIWAFAETALREHKSSKALSDYAEQQGFKVERGVEAIQAEFKEKTRGFVYKPYISDGPPPLPKQ